MSKQLTLIFNHFETEHLGKDVFLVPYSIGKKYGYDVTIVYPQTSTNANFPSEIKGVKLHPIKSNRRLKWFPIWRTLPFYLYLIRNAKKIDFLMRFHYQDHTYYHAFVYKLLNKRGILYVKSDGFPESFRMALANPSHLSCWRKRMFKMLVKNVDRFSIETSQVYDYMVKSGNTEFTEKLRLLPNGFDEDELQRLDIKENGFDEKENLFITVGRLGTPQKNTELILDALNGIEMKNWLMELIGPIDDALKPKIEEFYKRNPDKKEHVKFTGPIYDKRELWEHYNRAKVFLLSSDWESYALVLGEARRFHCFLISTDVGAGKDLCESGKFGHLIKVGDYKAMRQEILDVINGRTNIDVFHDFDMKSLSWRKLIEKLDLDQIISKNA